MESVIKQLVKIGHGMGAEVANDEPAVAKLLVELSSALDVQYERANALEAKCAALAAMKLALASMTAEPVAWQWEYRDKTHVTNRQARAKFVAQDGDVTVQPLFAAPPAPVSVPTFDEWLEIRGNKPLGWVKDAMRESYEACRAAMLQGKAGPVSQPFKLPPGWVMVPKDPTAAMYDAGDRQLVTKQVWDAMIAAAPQQEANP
ncbi:hypothetical protein LE058_11570 [Escherichia coli]|uniref:hypothetical protein n=1 Tax=Escherichia coli TaxID=562 RepID=UPI000DDAF075|nr:hypothetical protein [Escherichia coli]MCA7281699.1 hypothetical protein [Escherichia coli]